MLPLPEAIRLSLNEATSRSDAELLRRTYQDVLISLEGPSEERVGRDILVLCAETALKVSETISRREPARTRAGSTAATPFKKAKPNATLSFSPTRPPSSPACRPPLVPYPARTGWSIRYRSRRPRDLLPRSEQALERRSREPWSTRAEGSVRVQGVVCESAAVIRSYRGTEGRTACRERPCGVEMHERGSRGRIR